MRMLMLLVVAGVAGVWPPMAGAQDWDVVAQLPAGSRLRVVLAGQSFEGKLRAVDADTITVNSHSTRREDVQRIDRMYGRRARGAAIGILAGFSVGVLHSYSTAESNKLGFGLSFLGPRYAVFGGLLGALLSKPKAVTVYQR